MNERLLSSLGISGNDAKLYKAAIKARKATPAVLAKMIGIKRTTAYHMARTLVEKGLLREDTTKRPRIFLPATSEDIQEVIDKEHKQLGLREKSLKELSAELSRVTAEESYQVPQIRFVEEEKLKQFLYKETPKWHESLLKIDATWWGFQDHTFINHYSKITDWYWKRARVPLSVKLLSNQSAAERKMAGKYPRRTIKFWNKANNFASTTWVVGDYVVMVNTQRHPFYLVEIHDATMAHDLREVFKNLWSLI
ncbi:MAG: hypothetical protein A3D65_06450 [Candidatus Lloydbacteria bacterium RIFCSPHIGHO2_02_FULL_50_13]|uniref:Transcription regulator TrmB N-terminal domain-containing protein n=1 Tax=Candidatus Lloydbacteria bacterium RIFCSPHIGHO2_02_FULL_50_13 TaxID=1798661 RepID=A0A1G2D1F5_9BACT|nr:MAG: hypothetical protein A3D65_06450 [Candidatus Lloydbacteria bacterium RIFCSPHIGHO2_02_FULL_50_13]